MYVADAVSDATPVRHIDTRPDDLDDVRALAVHYGKIWFTARDADGFGVWVSDGTPDGTTRLDVRPGTSLLANFFYAHDGRVWFANAFADGAGEQPIWASDGTPEGTFDAFTLPMGGGVNLHGWAEGVLYLSVDTLSALVPAVDPD